MRASKQGKLSVVQCLQYWKNVHKEFRFLDRKADQKALTVVGRIERPLWYNKFFDHFTNAYFQRMLGLCGSIEMKSVLDVGCGGGRWSERLAGKGAKVLGIDIGREIIKKNTEISRGRCKYMVMSADNLGFHDEAFDLAVSVTVLQHMPYSTQMKAIEEIARIVNTNGKVLIVERVGRNALPYTFPNSEKEWTDKFESNGLTLVAKRRHFFSPLIDLGHALKCILRPKRGLGSKPDGSQPSEDRLAFWDKICDIVTRALIWISYPLGYICFYLFPQRFAIAKHSSFLFEKKASHARDDAQVIPSGSVKEK